MDQRARDNRGLLIRLGVAAAAMFGFGYALVPFYQAICEVAGINNLLRPDPVTNGQVDASRRLVIEFDANTHDLPWNFRPLQRSVEAHPGELIQVAFEVSNNRNVPVTGQAVPSYGPRVAGEYVRKLDCFCFTRQTLAPGEKRVMPVVFVVDPALPAEVGTFTLSYTFFEVAGTRSGLALAPPPKGAS